MSDDVISFNCDYCNSFIEIHKEENQEKPISGCPHYNRGTRGHVFPITVKLPIEIEVQYDPHLPDYRHTWVVKFPFSSKTASGATIEHAVSNLSRELLI